MFGLGAATRIYLAVGRTDMRKGFNGLFGLVRDRLQGEPLSGHVFLFCNAQRNRVKLLFWDGSGLWVCAKRLEKGKFGWPEVSGEQNKVQLSHEELALLLGGIDLRQAERRRWYRRGKIRRLCGRGAHGCVTGTNRTPTSKFTLPDYGLEEWASTESRARRE